MTTTRQRTRVAVLVHSHHGDDAGVQGRELEISNSVYRLQTNKNTKQAGKFTLLLAPHRNWLNYLFPNDVVNIYVDPGDGERGFVRLMMGYIDRIERSEVTGKNGETKTMFVVYGSDFQKAIDKTHIYFNAYMRTILDERFARQAGLGVGAPFVNAADGSVLRNAGITAFGSPADFVENFLQVLLGFAQQWQLPDGYSRNREQIRDARRVRLQRAQSRIPENIRVALQTLGYDVEGLTKDTIETVLEDITQILAAETKGEIFEIDAIGGGEVKGTVARQNQEIEAARTLQSNSALQSLRAILVSVDPSNPVNVLDLMSMDFIEALAIDGFNSNTAVWQASGTLAQFLYGNTNDIVNELIFDLRPVSEGVTGDDGGLRPGNYSRKEDELGVNVRGTDNMPPSVAGVKYVPAVVFREYPYSVIEKFSLPGLSIFPGETQQLNNVIDGFTQVARSLGLSVPNVPDIPSRTIAEEVLFGPVFAMEPNSAGRHIYAYSRPIAPFPERFGAGQRAVKHIDSITIRNTDVRSSKVGRSDDDTYNLIQLTPRNSSLGMTTHYRARLTNFSPIVNQVSVARAGLRVWEGVTQFAISPDAKTDIENLVRWHLLLDHWYQHNGEFLSGTISLRGMPEIRVGYRLDWQDHSESYYVEQVEHQWEYETEAMQTTVQVSRGQRNDPWPVYIPPVFRDDKNLIVAASGDRSETGRLSVAFPVRDTQASARSTVRTADPALGINTVDSSPPLFGAVVFPADAQVPEIQTIPDWDDEDIS